MATQTDTQMGRVRDFSLKIALWRFCPALIRKYWIAAAITEDDQAQAIAIISRDLSVVNLRTTAGEPLIVLAARLAHQEIFDCLLDHGADIHSSDTSCMTALIVCSAKGQLANVDRLLSMGANPAQADQVGLTALTLAASNGHLEIVSLLESKGAKLRRLDHVLKAIASDDTKALDRALASKSLAEMDWLLDGSPVLLAAHNGSAKVLQALLANGADPNSKTSLHGTPLGAAAASGKRESVEILLSYGADPTHIDKFKKTPRDYADEKDDREICAVLAAAESKLRRPEQ